MQIDIGHLACWYINERLCVEGLHGLFTYKFELDHNDVIFDVIEVQILDINLRVDAWLHSMQDLVHLCLLLTLD